MKMFVIVYWSASDDVVIASLAKIGVNAYTKWTKVLGCGTETEPKLGSGFWRGENNVLTAFVNDKDAAKVKDVVMNLREERPWGGIRGFIMPVEEMI
jgi:nitrogen regulatory protein PII